jgi:hypothetical protein
MELETRLQPRQLQAAEYWQDDETEELLYGGAKGGAKSNLGCNLIFGDALTYPETHYFIARENLNDLTRFNIPSITEVFDLWKLKFDDYVRYNGKDNYFILNNKSRVYYLDCKYQPRDPDFHRFGSMQFTRGWCEEIGQMNSKALVNLNASVGRWKNEKYGLKRKILYTCNPNKDYAYNKFYLPNKKGTLEPHRKFIKALPTDNKYLSKEYLAMLNRLPKNERERLYLGNWEYDDDPTALIDYENIIALTSNDHVEQGTKYIISDVARYGSDKAIVTIWNGLRLIEYHKFPISSTVEIQNCINAMRMKHGIPTINCLADEDGVGGGVVDNCKIKGFINGSKPVNPNYQNLKTECAYELAEVINEYGIYIECELPEEDQEAINEELGQLKTYDSDKDGKLRILPKEKIKENIGRSPDWLDVFIMRMKYIVDPVKIRKPHRALKSRR